MSQGSLKHRILYEDNHLIAVNKLAGELSQGDSTGDLPLLDKTRRYLKEQYHKPGNVFCGLIHRLDRPTSGLMLFAKTGKALTRMNKIFAERQLSKTYLAICAMPLSKPRGQLKHYLKKELAKNKSFVRRADSKGAKKAELRYSLLGRSDRYYLYEVELLTGRHHQIRAQFAEEGAPLRGDLKYGYPRSNTDGGISLHAYTLSFEHPVQKQAIEIKAPYPGTDKLWSQFDW